MGSPPEKYWVTRWGVRISIEVRKLLLGFRGATHW